MDEYRAVRTGPTDPDLLRLVHDLDKELATLNGADHSFFAQFNKLDDIKHVVIVYEGTVAVGCGAFKVFDNGGVEIKRMFTAPSHRRKGVASFVLDELERWAAGLGHRTCVLETGRKQPEAIALYTWHDYLIIPNYGQYAGVAESVCFGKELTHRS